MTAYDSLLPTYKTHTFHVENVIITVFQFHGYPVNEHRLQFFERFFWRVTEPPRPFEPSYSGNHTYRVIYGLSSGA